jgi:hypothetical protein
MPTLELRQRLEQPLEQLLQLLDLPVNWDSYGSRCIDRRAVASGILLLVQIMGEDVPTPQVCPVPGGGVQLEWQRANRALELEALPDGSVQFLTVDGDRMEEGSLDTRTGERTQELVRWLCAL